MAKGYQTWVGVGLGLLVLAAVYVGATQFWGGDDVAVDGNQLSAGTDPAGASTELAVAGGNVDSDLKSFADGSSQDSPLSVPESGATKSGPESGATKSAPASGAALRVDLDPNTDQTSTTAAGAASTTSTAIATTASTATSESPTTTTPAAESTTTTTMPTTVAAEQTTTTALAITSTSAKATTTQAEQTTTTAPPTSTTSAGSGDPRGFEQQVITLTNEARVANGCPPLTHNDKLHAAALGHSKDMYQNDYFSHDSLDGSTMADRINQQGYQWRRLAENIAYGYRTASSVVAGWMNSSGHRANILNCDLTEIGVGFHNFYWTQNFGTPR